MKESLRVDCHQRDAIREDSMKIVEENQNKRVNSGKWSKHEKGDRCYWTVLRDAVMFGTDFGGSSFRAVLEYIARNGRIRGG